MRTYLFIKSITGIGRIMKVEVGKGYNWITAGQNLVRVGIPFEKQKNNFTYKQ